MADMSIPNPVIYAVGDVLGGWYYSHSKLNTLFRQSGAPGDPPEGNCVEKCQAWLRRANDDPEVDALGLLGKVLIDYMSRELHGDPGWEKGYNRIQKALADNNLAYHPDGRVIPTQTERRFRVALSFPGERRGFVEDVALHLAHQMSRERVLYDEFHEAEFAQPDLDVYLPNLYRTESELIVIFLCEDYAKKRWCKLEWRSIRQLISTSDAMRIMFLSFDDIGAIPEIGILSGDGYVSIGSRSPQEIAVLIYQRLELNADRSDAPRVQQAPPAISPNVRSIPRSGALSTWQKKLAFLQTEEAKAVDAEQKFAIHQRIEEAKEKIRELGGETS
jgi:hypothetical protein